MTGTGLGLAVVRELVEAQGARCWIEEAAGKRRAGRGADGEGGGALMTKVLVVEDHHAIARGLRENLELEGFEVRVSSDGIDAIQVASSWVPDLVLLDLMLPKRSGFDVLAAIRAGGADMLVMVVSARGSEAEKVRALQAGADDYVVKPFALMEVLARVHALLRRTSGDRADGGQERALPGGRYDVDVPTRSVCRRGRARGVTAEGVRPAGGAVPGAGSGRLPRDAPQSGLGIRSARGHAHGRHPHRRIAPATGGRRR